MFLNRIQVFIIVLGTHILFPLGLLLSLFIINNGNVITYGVCFLLVGNILWLMSKVFVWEFTFYSLKWTYLLAWVMIGGYILILKLVLGMSAYYHLLSKDIIVIALGLVGNLIMLYLHLQVHQSIASVRGSGEIIQLKFPCSGSAYLITDGGDGRISSLMNYHYKASIHGENNTHKSMRYAVDIVKMGKYGRTVKSTICHKNQDYYIYGEKVYSPLDGEVLRVENEIKDNQPFPVKLPYHIGNHVVIKHDNYYCVIGHLQKGSVLVKKGDLVKAGTELGSVGNSGLTPRPHIHLQVSISNDGNFWSGDGVPISFENGFTPIKNYMFKLD